MVDFLKDLFKFNVKEGDTSPKGTLDKTDVIKLVRNALFVGATALVGALLTGVVNLDVGNDTLLALGVAATAAALEAVHRWLKDNQDEQSPEKTE